MKNRLGSWMIVASLLLVALAALPVAQAQRRNFNGPSKYLYLGTVSLKPGSMGRFTSLEQARIAELRGAKDSRYFFTMEQITGSNMLISLAGFDSFADLQKAHDQIYANAQLAEKLEDNGTTRGALIREVHDSIYMFRKDLSLHSDQSLEDMRFMRMSVIEVKPGHNADLENIAKAEVKAQGSNADVHWAVFEKIYGQGSGRVYLLVTPMKSLSEVDTMIANRQKSREMVGEGLRHLVMSVEGKSISMSESDLFAFAPKISYVPDSWLKASPDFWGKK